MAFYSMFIIVLIIVVVSSLLYFSLRKYFKKSILIVACCCIALIGLLSVVFYNAGFQDSVFVYGITAQENDENPSFFV